MNNIGFNELSNRKICFLCESPRFPWAMTIEAGEWVCRACVNYEGTERLPYSINNARILKNHVREQFFLRLVPKNIPNNLLKNHLINNYNTPKIPPRPKTHTYTGNSDTDEITVLPEMPNLVNRIQTNESQECSSEIKKQFQ